MNETNITFTVDMETKIKAETIFSMLGLDMETALQIFLKRAVEEKGLPFNMNLNSENKPKPEPAPKSTIFGNKDFNDFNEKAQKIPGEIAKSVSDFLDNITK